MEKKERGIVMNTLGIIFMATSWTTIIALTIFCFQKILTEKEEKIIGPLEVEAQMDEEDKKA